MTVKELRDKVADMPSYILDDDFVIYHRYLPFFKETDTIFDLGTGWGKSAIAMALMNPEVTIQTIDDGSYPIYQSWADSESEYAAKLKSEFKKHEAFNVMFIQGNLLNISDDDMQKLVKASLIHVDLIAEKEIAVLTKWLPKIEINGLALIRNFERMEDKLGDLLKDFEQIDKSGLIYVYRRIR